MTGMAAVAAIMTALDLPPGARVDARVPKKMLVEQGAPTSADKRAIQDGVEELQWLAALKPNTVAIPAFTDEAHDYSEIAVIAAIFRADARATRLTELIHRAIPYPVLLITVGSGGLAVSVAPKRAAQNEGGKVVVERVVALGDLDPEAPPDTERAFLGSLALKSQPSRDLSAVYNGWLAPMLQAMMDKPSNVGAPRWSIMAHLRAILRDCGPRPRAKSSSTAVSI